MSNVTLDATSPQRENPTHEPGLDRRTGILASLAVIFPEFRTLINSVTLDHSLFGFRIGDLCVVAVILPIIAFAAPTILRRLRLATLALPVLITFILIGSYLLHSSEATYYLRLFPLVFLGALPWLYVMAAIRKHESFLRYLYVAAHIALAAGVIAYFLQNTAHEDNWYSQSGAYQQLPAAIIFADAIITRFRVRDLLFFALSAGLMLSMGARGPLVALALFVPLRLYLSFRSNPRRSTHAVLLPLAPLALILILGIDELVRRLSSFLAFAGLSSRVADKFLAGTFLEDEIRASLAEYSAKLILQFPGTGVGAGADRTLLANSQGESDPAAFLGYYPHNLFLELLVQFGIPVGILLITLLALLLLRAFQVGTECQKRLILFQCAIGLFPLMVSGSYLASPFFYGLVGYCITVVQDGRHFRSQVSGARAFQMNRHEETIRTKKVF